jgi:choline dehydrogenase
VKPFDVLVLGGGAAGCVLAARLSEDADPAVCLVEAGPEYGPFGADRWPAEILDAKNIPSTHDWERATDERGTARAKIIGGRASVMPTIPRANTHLSTIAIAERAATWI